MENKVKTEKLALSVDEFAVSLGIGRNKAYEMTQEPGFPTVKLGRRIVIPVEPLKAWLAKQAPDVESV